METFLSDAVREHLLKNDLISSQQHGFIPGRSTSSQLLECFDEWSLLIEEGSSVDVIYLDFKKAFDAVPHKRLINKLHAYGIRRKVLAWIDAFLTQRAQSCCKWVGLRLGRGYKWNSSRFSAWSLVFSDIH